MPGVTRCRLSLAHAFELGLAVALGLAGDGLPPDWADLAHPASARHAATIATVIFVTRMFELLAIARTCAERPPPGPERSTRGHGGRLAGWAERCRRPRPTGGAPR